MEYGTPTGRLVNDDHLVANALDQWKTLLNKSGAKPGELIFMPTYSRLPGKSWFGQKWFIDECIKRHEEWQRGQAEIADACRMMIHHLRTGESMARYFRELDVFRQNGVL